MLANIKDKNILLCGSGSGGHFYPSLQLAYSLDKLNANIYYIVAENKLDSFKIKETSFKYLTLKSVGLKSNFFSFFKAQFMNIKQCFKYIKDKNIDIVIGFGGSLSFSMCIAALLSKTKFIVHEQNVIIGRANKLISYLKPIYSSFPLNIKKDRYKVVGSPLVNNNKLENVKCYDVIFVMGSLGSSSVDKIIEEYLKKFNPKWKILIVSKNIVFKSENVDVFSYLDGIENYFHNANLIITRGGASTLSQLSKTKSKVIIIPSPNVVNNHQYHNAIYFKDNYGCEIVLEKDLTSINLSKLIEDNLNMFKSFNERKQIEKNNQLFCF